MKSINKNLFSLLTAGALSFFSLAASSAAADLSAADKQFLGGYEKIHAALVADNLDSAKQAAASLGVAGAEVGKSKTLDEARNAFVKLGVTAVKLAAGQPGYYILHCPMVGKDWVQTSPVVANPFGGKEMVGCGEVK